VIVEKRTIGGNAEFMFSGIIKAILSDGQMAMEEVIPGEYLEHEALLPGWDLVDLECDDNNSGPYGPNGDNLNGGYAGTALYIVEPGEIVTCVFVNRRRAELIVEKVTVSSNPADHTTDFSYSTSGLGLPANFLLDGVAADDGVPNERTFINLIPGNYSVTETVPAGWDLTGLECQLIPGTGLRSSNWNINDALAAVNLAAGDTVKCTYTNTKQIMIDLLKTTNGLVNPNLDWRFALYNGPDGFNSGAIASDSTLGDGDGLLDFGNIYVPALATYTVCELGIPADTNAFWSLDIDGDGVGDVPLDPYNPNADDPIPEDLGNRCVDFGATGLNVEPGATLHLVVDNVFQGDNRTPGYWKNWNTCTNGNQVQTAAKNNEAAGSHEYWLTDDLLVGGYNDQNGGPVVYQVGGVPVPDCETAVAILDSRSLTDGKKMSRYADFTLARALLAAKLNLAAGAAISCTDEIMYYVDEADYLLDHVGYDAIKGKLRPKNKYHGPALHLAGILDDYNNNECSTNGN
jgi:hypothetical protein